VGYPRLSASRVGESIAVWNCLVRDDVLPRLEMPPQIGIRDVARPYKEQARDQDQDENASGFEQVKHADGSYRGGHKPV